MTYEEWLKAWETLEAEWQWTPEFYQRARLLAQEIQKRSLRKKCNRALLPRTLNKFLRTIGDDPRMEAWLKEQDDQFWADRVKQVQKANAEDYERAAHREGAQE